MARKEDAEPKDEYEFVPPDFDEEAFIHKEMVSFRTTVILFLWGIIAAGISFVLFGVVGGPPSGWWLGILIAVTLGFALKWVIPATKTDISHWGRREWLGTSFLFFFTWLSFFILLINPPISDYSAPEVDLYASPSAQQVGASVVLDVFLADNDAIDAYTIDVAGPSGPIEAAFAQIASDHYRATVVAPDAGTYRLTASANDGADHVTTSVLNFTASNDALAVSVRDLAAPQDSVFVRPDADASALHAVYLEMVDRTCTDAGADGERLCRVYLQYDEALGGWEATANMDGWTTGNNTFRVVAEEKNVFHGQTLVEGGRITSEGPYTVKVSTSLGTYDDHIPGPQRTEAPLRNTPGPALPLVIVGIVGLAIVVRKRS